jgi:hypothetical protein
MRQVSNKILVLLLLGLLSLTAAGQTSARRKKLKATPILKTNQRSIKVKSYVRKGKTVRAHKRTITNK